MHHGTWWQESEKVVGERGMEERKKEEKKRKRDERKKNGVELKMILFISSPFKHVLKMIRESTQLSPFFLPFLSSSFFLSLPASFSLFVCTVSFCIVNLLCFIFPSQNSLLWKDQKPFTLIAVWFSSSFEFLFFYWNKISFQHSLQIYIQRIIFTIFGWIRNERKNNGEYREIERN